MTGGLNDVDRPDTLDEDQLQECVNYEIAGVGRLKKRTDPSVYDGSLNNLLSGVFDGGVISISEPFYPPVKPHNMTGDFILAVYGVSGGVRSLEAFYRSEDEWINQDSSGSSFFKESLVPPDSEDVEFLIAGGEIIISSKSFRSIAVSIDRRDRSLRVGAIGMKAPSNKPVLFPGNVGGDFRDDINEVDYTEADDGMSEPGLIQCQYTVVGYLGNESNPSPISSTLFAQIFKVGDDGVSDELFIDRFKVHGLSVPDVDSGTSKDYEFFNIYVRVFKYSEGNVSDSMEFSKQVRIINKEFGVFYTGNDYIVDIPKVSGQIISYENDVALKTKTTGWNGGVFMSGNSGGDAGSLPEFSYIAPISITNNSGRIYVDRSITLRLNWKDFKDHSENTLMPEWGEWFVNGITSSVQFPSNYRAAKWRQNSFSRHIRFYLADQTTPLVTMINGEYDEDGNLDFVIRVPVISGGVNFIYLAWNDINQPEDELQHLGFNEKFDLYPEDSPNGYFVEGLEDSYKYGWYFYIAFHYGRFSTQRESFIRDRLIVPCEASRDGGAEFLANFYDKESISDELAFEGGSLMNVSNIAKSGRALATLNFRPVESFGYKEFIADRVGVSVSDLTAEHYKIDFSKIGSAYLNNNLVGGLGDERIMFPSVGVDTADSGNYLQIHNLDSDGDLLSNFKAEWLNYGFHGLLNMRRYCEPFKGGSSISSGWTGSDDDKSFHINLGGFIPASGGYSMSNIADNMGKVPSKSYMRVGISFNIHDLVKLFNNKLSNSYSPTPDGWSGGVYGDTFFKYIGATDGNLSGIELPGGITTNPHYGRGGRGWIDCVILYWSAGAVDLDEESDTWGSVTGGMVESPLHNRGELFVEIRRTGTTSTGINPSTQKYEMLLTYNHASEERPLPSYMSGLYLNSTTFEGREVSKSIVISDAFRSDSEGSFVYTGDEDYKDLDIILSADFENDMAYLFCLDKKFNNSTESELKSLRIELDKYVNSAYDSASSNNLNGTNYYKSEETPPVEQRVLENTWKGKNFFDMGIGISNRINIINGIADEDGDILPFYDYDAQVTYNGYGDLPSGRQTSLRYSAAQGFYSSFEFNSSTLVDSEDMAREIFYGMPIDSNIGLASDGTNKNMYIGESYENTGGQTSGNMVRWSDAGAKTFPDLNYKLLKESVKRIISAPSFLQFEYSNTFLIFTRNTINRFVLKGDAEGWSGSSDSLIEENTRFGLYADNTLVRVGKEVFWLSEEGVIRWNAEGMVNISKNVIDIGNSGELYDADKYRAIYCPVRNQFILQVENRSFVYDLTYRRWTSFDGLEFSSAAVLSGGSQGDNINLLLNDSKIYRYPGEDLTEDSAYIKTKDVFLDAGKIDRVRLQYIGETNAKLTYELNGETRAGDAYTPRTNIINPIKANVWRGAGNLGFGRMASFKVEDADEIHSIMFDVKLKGGE